MGSLISSADDSSWKYVACTDCEGKFENKMDMEYHKQRIHTYGKTCSLYPCEECGFQGTDVVKLKDHIEEYHRREGFI